jgi:hypothetical protein
LKQNNPGEIKGNYIFNYLNIRNTEILIMQTTYQSFATTFGLTDYTERMEAIAIFAKNAPISQKLSLEPLDKNHTFFY